jgi:hypothetical protein
MATEAPALARAAAASLSRDPRTLALATGDADAPRKFQALLATMLVKEMRRSIGGELFGAGSEGDVYGGWFDEHLGETLAQRDALHVENVLRESLARKASGGAQP